MKRSIIILLCALFFALFCFSCKEVENPVPNNTTPESTPTPTPEPAPDPTPTPEPDNPPEDETDEIKTPVFSASPDEYFVDSFSLNLQTDQEGCDIYYSLNNSENFEKYSTSIQINETTTVSCYAQSGNGEKSETVSATFTKDNLSISDLGNVTQVKEGVYVYNAIQYGSYSGNDGTNTFNLYLPDRIENINERKTAVFYVHGGSWNSGSPDEYERYFETGNEKYATSYVTEYGLPVVSLDYRHIGVDNQRILTDYATVLSSTYETPLDYYFFNYNGNKITDQISDIKKCMDFVKTHAQLLKVNTVFCIFDGYSAGANLALLFTLSDEYEKKIPIKALIDRCGPADMSSYEYVRFFSDILVYGSFQSGFFSITMTDGTNDGDRFLESMINSSTNLNLNFDQIKTLAQNGINNAPDQIKNISPAYFAQNSLDNSLPYIVMAYGNDVDLEIGVDIGNRKANPNLKGDPLAPRKAGELLASNLDRKNILQYDNGRIKKNYNENSENPFVYYKGNIDNGEKIAFIGSSVGGHDICSKNDNESFSKKWTDSELSCLQEAVSYAIETVCGISPN